MNHRIKKNEKIELSAPLEVAVYEMLGEQENKVWESFTGFPFDGKRTVHIRLINYKSIELQYRDANGTITEIHKMRQP